MELISRFDIRKEYATAERCYIVEIHNTATDPGCSIARARVAPGETTQLHSLRGTIERYVILEGAGTVEIGGEAPVAVGPLDVVRIDADTPQRIANTGNTDLVFLCVCTPRFEQKNYASLDV